jgi:hypothetical protein
MAAPPRAGQFSISKAWIHLPERLTAEIIRGMLDGTTDLGIVSGPHDAEGWRSTTSAPTG